MSGSSDFRSFAFGDVDGDRLVDAVVATSGSPGAPVGRIELLRGDGAGGFSRVGELGGVPVGRVALGDLNGDGRVDLAVSRGDAGSGNAGLDVVLNAEGLAFRPASWSPTLGDVETWDVHIMDATRDGRNDILAATVDAVRVYVGTGTVFVQMPGSPYRAGPGAYHLAAGDINEDGRLDIVASSFEGNSLTILLGTG